MPEYDSEIQKMIYASHCKNSRSSGFQGCANLKKGCNFRGFYLCTYSEEGLCSDCELKTFPNRYKGCASCGKAVRYSIFCHGCENGFKEWLFDLFYNKNKNSKSTSSCFAIKTKDETDDWKLWSNIGIGTHCIVSKYDPVLPVRHLNKGDMFNDVWPGFHIGNDQYVKPDPFELKSKICISDITWENKHIVLIRELNKLGIFPYSLIQLVQADKETIKNNEDMTSNK